MIPFSWVCLSISQARSHSSTRLYQAKMPKHHHHPFCMPMLVTVPSWAGMSSTRTTTHTHPWHLPHRIPSHNQTAWTPPNQHSNRLLCHSQLLPQHFHLHLLSPKRRRQLLRLGSPHSANHQHLPSVRVRLASHLPLGNHRLGLPQHHHLASHRSVVHLLLRPGSEPLLRLALLRGVKEHLHSGLMH